MKNATRILSLALCFIMLFSAVPISAASDESYELLSANDIFYAYGAFSTLDASIENDATGKYIHLVASPGEYGNNDLCFFVSFDNVALNEYPYVTYQYRTDSQKNSVDVGQINEGGENWMNSSPSQISDGKWHKTIVDINEVVGNASGAPAAFGEKNIRFRLKPWGSHNKTLEATQYFDIQYVAAFKTKADAEQFVFDKDHDYGSLYNDEYVKEHIDNISYYEATQEDIDKYLDEAYALIDKIRSSETDVEYTGTAYYVSYKGDNSNNGLSPETAWKSVSKVSGANFLKEGDAVLFERGGSYRYTGTFATCPGVTYSTFGTGSKPKLIGSIDASDEADWEETEYENVWKYTGTIGGGANDVGQIVFDMGRAWGIKLINGVWVGENSNGLEMIDTGTAEITDPSGLKHDLEFWHQLEYEVLYLYSKDGNPATRFSSIEIVDKGNGISSNGNSVTIDNLELFGFGSHGIGYGTTTGLTVQNCVFSFIGGSRQYNELDQVTRFGNAVEIYGGAKDFIIRNCYANNIYDCCWTTQYQSNSNGQDIFFENVEFYNNVACYSNTGLEVWLNNKAEYNNTEATYGMKNLHLHDNYTFYNGYGWSQSRPSKDGNIFYGDPSVTTTVYENCSVDHNVGMFASKWLNFVRYTGTQHYNFNNNIYFQQNDKLFGGVAADPEAGTGNVGQHRYDRSTMTKLLLTGFEPGSTFYYTESDYTVPEYEPEPISFSDVASEHWAYKNIESAVMRGFMGGISEDEFSPDSTMTRAMLVTLLSRLDTTSRVTEKAPYTDINANAWYASAVNYAYTAGLVGDGLTKFRPDDAVTREEMADMLYRFFLSNRMTSEQESISLSFTDADSVSDEYASGVAFATENGIINGYPDGTVRPLGTATRAEVATMLKRFSNLTKALKVDYSDISDKTDFHVYNGAEISDKLSTAGSDKKVDSETNTLVLTPNDPTATSSSVRFTVYERLLGFKFSDYPFIKLRINLSGDAKTLGIGINKNNVEKWITPSIKTGEWCDVIVCIYDMIPPGEIYSGDALNSVILCDPWSQGSAPIFGEDSCRIEYMGFFPTKDAAIAYNG